MPARAAEQDRNGSILTYGQDFFAGAQLGTAYDMVGRLPGFAFDDGSNARGFAGTAGNVLIDGARPTAKTDDLNAILQRIPVARVARIEVIRGGAPGIDMQGQSVVANIILKREDSTTITALIGNTYYGDGRDEPAGSLQFTRRSGDRVYDLTLNRYDDLNDDSAGEGHYAFSRPGEPVQTGAAARRGGERVGWGLNSAATLGLWGGTFGANLTLKQTIYTERVLYDAPLSAVYYDNEKAQPFELGLNWQGVFGASDVTLLALQRLEQDRSLNTAADNHGAQAFTGRRDTGETILRGTWRYRWTPKLVLESGGEAAYNSLNGRSDYLLNGSEIAVPAADARVGERRGEVFTQATWKFTGNALVEAGLRAEFSRISALGVPSRSFSYAKPRLLLSWSPVSGSQFRLRAEKVVGQLDFTNFVASSDLAGNGVSAGNLALRPDERWQFEAAYELHFWSRGALVVSAMHEDIRNLVDYVPIGGGLDGPGNIAKAGNNEFHLDFSVPLERLGVAGGTLKGTAKWYDSALPDPVTGAFRSISGWQDRNMNFHYTQDIPAWKSSLDFGLNPGGWSRPNYRIAQRSEVRLLTPFVSAAWDYKPRPDLDFYVELDNFLPYRLEIEQDNYAGPRNPANLASILDVKTNSEPRLWVQLRKIF